MSGSEIDLARQKLQAMDLEDSDEEKEELSASTLEACRGEAVDLQKVHFSGEEKKRIFNELKENKALKNLNLSAMHLTAEDAYNLAQCLKKSPVRELDLSYNKIGSSGALAIIHNCPSLEVLHLRCTFLNDEFAKELPSQGRSLRLDLSQNHITDQGARYLIKNPRIRDSLSSLLMSNLISNPVLIQQILDLCPIYVEENDAGSVLRFGH